ncbi:hypothetical protein DENSPDRAFT_833906 [Dentipellis sp. KUC8613]|nr:hypothetical protein DENSPDRAFT_833906 [Dentipellis sp. KUC8613]
MLRRLLLCEASWFQELLSAMCSPKSSHGSRDSPPSAVSVLGSIFHPPLQSFKANRRSTIEAAIQGIPNTSPKGPSGSAAAMRCNLSSSLGLTICRAGTGGIKLNTCTAIRGVNFRMLAEIQGNCNPLSSP